VAAINTKQNRKNQKLQQNQQDTAATLKNDESDEEDQFITSYETISIQVRAQKIFQFVIYFI
jgi:hypothetical protein